MEKLKMDAFNKVDINLITKHKLFPCGTRLENEVGAYRYTKASNGYSWVDEPIWEGLPLSKYDKEDFERFLDGLLLELKE